MQQKAIFSPNLILKRTLLLSILVVGLVRLESEAKMEKESGEIQPLARDVDQLLSRQMLQFGARLMEKLDRSKQNVAFSPTSIHSALGMALLGATTKSATESELLETLGCSREKPEEMHDAYRKLLAHFRELNLKGLEAHNKRQAQAKNSDQEFATEPMAKDPIVDVWTMGLLKGQFEPLSSFKSQLSGYYNSSFPRIDDQRPERKSELLEQVNRWAKEAGYQGKVIDKSQLDEQFSMILMSAIRTEAFWFHEFSEYQMDELFYNHGLRGKQVRNSNGLANSDIQAHFVEFSENLASQYEYYNGKMRQAHGSRYQSLAKLEFYMVKLSLVGEVSFVIVEPLKSGSGEELAKLEEALLKANGSQLASALEILDHPASEHELDSIQMPPFKFETDLELIEGLSRMGLRRAFDRSRAEFGRLANQAQCIDKVRHKAVVEVNKRGLKAAGLTTIRMVPLMAKIVRNPIRLKVENPFMFLIQYSKIPLFMGHVVELP